MSGVTIKKPFIIDSLRYQLRNSIFFFYFFCQRIQNTIALRRKTSVFDYLGKRINRLNSREFVHVSCLPTFSGNYYFINNTELISDILKHPRLKEGDFLGEGRQLYVLAEALGRYRMSEDRKDAKQKRGILAELLSKPERHIAKIQTISEQLIKMWLQETSNDFYISKSIRVYTLEIYLRSTMNYAGEIEPLVDILEQQISLLAKRLVYRAGKNFEHKFTCLRDQLVKLLVQDEGFCRLTNYTNQLNNYIDERYRPIQEQAFLSGINGGVLAGYMAPYPTFLAMVYELGANPHYQQQLYDEYEHYRSIGLSDEDIIKQEDSLLNAVVHEIMRLHPAQPFIFRSAIKSFKLGKDFIKKGGQVVLNIYHAHRDAGIWGESANVFYPERFVERPMHYRSHFLAYSSGPNNCTGQFFSRMSLKILLLEMVKNIRLEVASGDLSHQFNFALDYKDSVKIKLVPSINCVY